MLFKKPFMLLIWLSIAISGCDQIANDDNQDDPQQNSASLKIYPANPVIPKDGYGKVTAIVEENGNILENSDQHELSATYKIADETIAEIDQEGNITGKNPGETQLTVTISDASTNKTYTNQTTLKVETIDVSKIFINPSVASIPKDTAKKFQLAALDVNKSPTTIESERISFDYPSSLLSVEKIINTNTAQLQVTAKALKGYAFITPQYTEGGITITGEPALVQFSSIPQVSAPQDLSAGKEITFLRERSSDGDKLYIAHTNGDDKLYFERFLPKTGTWQRSDMDFSGTTIKAPKLFSDNEKLYILAIVDNELGLFQSSDSGSTWSFKTLSSDLSLAHVDANNIDVVKIDQSILVLLANDKDLKLIKIGLDSEPSAEVLLSHQLDYSVKSLDFTTKSTGKLRFVLNDNQGNVYFGNLDENNATGKMVTIAKNTSAMEVKIDYNRYDAPVIVYSASGKLVKYKLNQDNNWASSTISSLQFAQSGFSNTDALDYINAFDFKVDKFSNARILMAANEALYYIKEFGRDDAKDWRIDKIVDSNVGENLALQIDNKNRLKVIYEDIDTGWVKYFAEPVFIRYNDKYSTYSVDDEITDPNAITF